MKKFKIIFSILAIAIFFTAIFALIAFLHIYYGLPIASPAVLTINRVLLILTPVYGIIVMLTFIAARHKMLSRNTK